MYVMSRAGCKKGDDCNFKHPTAIAMMQQVVDEIKPAPKKGTSTRKVTHVEEDSGDFEINHEDSILHYKGRKVTINEENGEEVKDSYKTHKYTP